MSEIIQTVVVVGELFIASLHIWFGSRTDKCDTKLFQFEQSYNTAEATKNNSGSKDEGRFPQYSKQMIQEILLELQEPWWSNKVNKT